MLFLFWHKYTYANDDLIIDSTFEYFSGNWLVKDGPEYTETALYSITKYDLDYLGRVIKETSGFNDENIHLCLR